MKTFQILASISALSICVVNANREVFIDRNSSHFPEFKQSRFNKPIALNKSTLDIQKDKKTAAQLKAEQDLFKAQKADQATKEARKLNNAKENFNEILNSLKTTGNKFKNFVRPQTDNDFGTRQSSTFKNKKGENVGVLINKVMPNSSAAIADLNVGDVVIGLNGYRVTNANEFRAIIDQAAKNSFVEVYYLKKGLIDQVVGVNTPLKTFADTSKIEKNENKEDKKVKKNIKEIVKLNDAIMSQKLFDELLLATILEEIFNEFEKEEASLSTPSTVTFEDVTKEVKKASEKPATPTQADQDRLNVEVPNTAVNKHIINKTMSVDSAKLNNTADKNPLVKADLVRNPFKVESIDPSKRESYGLESNTNTGCLITDINTVLEATISDHKMLVSPMEMTYGLQKGDVLLSVDGKLIDITNVNGVISKLPASKPILIEFLRNKKIETAEVKFYNNKEALEVINAFKFVNTFFAPAKFAYNFVRSTFNGAGLASTFAAYKVAENSELIKEFALNQFENASNFVKEFDIKQFNDQLNSIKIEDYFTKDAFKNAAYATGEFAKKSFDDSYNYVADTVIPFVKDMTKDQLVDLVKQNALPVTAATTTYALLQYDWKMFNNSKSNGWVRTGFNFATAGLMGYAVKNLQDYFNLFNLNSK